MCYAHHSKHALGLHTVREYCDVRNLMLQTRVHSVQCVPCVKNAMLLLKSPGASIGHTVLHDIRGIDVQAPKVCIRAQ